MTHLSLQTDREKDTVAVGRRLGELAQPGDVYLLSGDLGTGKTCLVKGVACGLGVTDLPFSPSFVLIREYRGRLMLYHMDFYRIDRVDEIAALGIDDYLNGEGVCAVEWADRAEGLLPEQCLRITLSYIEEKEQSRRLVLQASGDRYARLLESLSGSFGAAHTWN